MVLIYLLYNYFCNNIGYRKFPNHMDQVFKQHVSKIKFFIFNEEKFENISEINLNSSTIVLSKLTSLSMF
jgi:hypothetical protein